MQHLSIAHCHRELLHTNEVIELGTFFGRRTSGLASAEHAATDPGDPSARAELVGAHLEVAADEPGPSHRGDQPRDLLQQVAAPIRESFQREKVNADQVEPSA